MNIIQSLKLAVAKARGTVLQVGGGAGMPKSGAYVTESTAMNYSAVFGCVRVISESIGMLPLHLYQYTDAGKEIARDHPLDYLLNVEPNPCMDAALFREVMMGHVLLWGNAYAEIEFDKSGQIVALWPLTPNRVQVLRTEEGEIFYQVRTPDDKEVRLPAACVLHIMGYSDNGLVGRSVLSVMREAVGLGMAVEEFGARYFGNGTNLGGFLETPGRLSPESYDRLKTDINEKYQGLGKSHRVIILEEGAKFSKLTIPPNDSQMLETRRFQIEEIARFYRVPMHLLQSLDRSTHSNIEHQGMDFVTYCLQSWLTRWEKALTRKLLFEDEKRLYFPKFNLGALLRGDMASRYQSYAIGRQWGWLCADDVREFEDMNHLPDGQGQSFMFPMNMISAERADDFFSEQADKNAVRSLHNGLEEFEK